MTVSWFLTFRHPNARASDDDLARAGAVVRGLQGVAEAFLFTPASSHDPYLDDGAPPPLVIEMTFAHIEELEAAAGQAGGLAGLASLSGAEIAEQAMLTRVFLDAAAPRLQSCTYLVAYEGEADDTNAWLTHYVTHHPPIMARFPGIRAIKVYSRLDWCSATGWRRENAMQRNKVVFDSPEALTAALNTPVRHEMRADYAAFPKFSGMVRHFPMWTERIV